jgi:hypothetical protein
MTIDGSTNDATNGAARTTKGKIAARRFDKRPSDIGFED